ncbi:hypothetical protein FVER14953_20308 [Fusarium verticillioides]|nr:hypothetical protein FVER14953_20308 [Fusarium verticillioides]
MGAPSSNDLSQKPLRPVTQVQSTPDYMERTTYQERQILKSMMEQPRTQQSASILTWPEFMAELLNVLQPDIKSRL